MDMKANNDERKEYILDLFKNNIQQLNDHQFKFKTGDVKYFCQTDMAFMVKLFKIIKQTPLLEAKMLD